MGSTLTTIPLGNRPYTSAFYSIGIEICQNLYLEIAESENAKASYYMIKIPGMQRFGSNDATNLGGCRCLFTSGSGRTFGVWGSTFAELTSTGAKNPIGQINSTNGLVQMAENGLQIMLVDGRNGWIYDYPTATFTVITDSYFPGIYTGTDAPTHVTYNDLRFIVNVPNTNQYYWSWPKYTYDSGIGTGDTPYNPAVADGYWTPINSGQKFGQADNISGLIACQNYIWLFGYNTCEVHYDTGNFNGQLYARYDGAIIEIGCQAPKSIAKWGNNVFWLGSDKTGTLAVFTNEGMQPKRISKRGIEQIIQSFDKYNDAIGWTYSQCSHTFYCLYFASANRTFVYDLVTDAWHERTFLNEATGLVEAHKAIYATENFNNMIIGHIDHSTAFTFSLDYYLNDNPSNLGYNYIKYVKTSPIAFSNGCLVRYNSIQAIFQQGVGLLTGYGADPKCWIGWSDDAGRNWTEVEAPLGMQGDYTKRTRVMSAGVSRNRVWRISGTDPVQIIMVGLIVDSVVCRF